MTTPDEPVLATVEERVTAALDTCDDILTVLPRLVERLEALESRQLGTGTTVLRGDFRLETFAQPDDSEQPEGGWQRLNAWVDWLVATYRLASIVPPCWAAHPAIREELVSLWLSWTAAWDDTTSPDGPLAWQERLERARARLADGNWGMPRCTGTHDPSGIDLADIYRAWRHDHRRPDKPLDMISGRHGGEWR